MFVIDLMLILSVSPSTGLLPSNDLVKNLNRSCGRILTSQDAGKDWTLSGQCVVIHQRLLATAAHVCFYYKDGKCLRYYLQALFVSDDGTKYSCDVHAVRWSGTMDVAILYIPDSADLQSFVTTLPIFPHVSSDHVLYPIHFVHYPPSADFRAIQAVNPNSPILWPRTPNIQPYSITHTPMESEYYCNSLYVSNAGDSGAGVLYYDQSQRLFQLLGIHLGSEHRTSEETLVLTNIAADSAEPRVKKPKIDRLIDSGDDPETSINSSETVEESGTDEKQEISTSTNSVPSESKGDDNTLASMSAVHFGQTNMALPYFIPAHIIMERPKWAINDIINNNPSAYEHNNSPPRLPRSSSSAVSIHPMETRSMKQQQRENGLLPLRPFPSLSLYDE
jgi:hypothetical protein